MNKISARQIATFVINQVKLNSYCYYSGGVIHFGCLTTCAKRFAKSYPAKHHTVKFGDRVFDVSDSVEIASVITSMYDIISEVKSDPDRCLQAIKNIDKYSHWLAQELIESLTAPAVESEQAAAAVESEQAAAAVESEQAAAAVESEQAAVETVDSTAGVRAAAHANRIFQSDDALRKFWNPVRRASDFANAHTYEARDLYPDASDHYGMGNAWIEYLTDVASEEIEAAQTTLGINLSPDCFSTQGLRCYLNDLADSEECAAQQFIDDATELAMLVAPRDPFLDADRDATKALISSYYWFARKQVQLGRYTADDFGLDDFASFLIDMENDLRFGKSSKGFD